MPKTPNPTGLLPDALEKSGNFSESTTPIYDPTTGTASGAGRTAFPGNIIPASRIDPIAQTLEQHVTSAECAGGHRGGGE